ncbi:conserved hypothetical protein [Nitrobacter hamburgensis X14]|uniref:Cas9 alpha-helical lobe domain-containing protein n=1 Tax=Nitrobacter hamburgensis (strain DSM 10229 / NCIMB 13809 / X14) TaxID=323097 RepID=Q1QJJ4_NITHX|nr:type II CRISPR RNA-guided endonuclease Cas9 [Nitrobacter hamburgensis]ABE63603.1 conserved hypothetical protein [Nitrobacter hamburgensis X14]
MHKRNSRSYRLGLDLGSNSLGWFVTHLEKRGDRYEPVALDPGGVRIFPDGRDPQSGMSNAVDRRMARGARKRRDRFVDPYALRKAALTNALPAHRVGRAIFHLNQRRGFQSNRKTDRKQSEDGAIKQAASKLKARMHEEAAPTLGAFFADMHLRKSYDDQQTAIRAELVRLGKDHLTGNARKKVWAKVRKRLFGDEVLRPKDTSDGARARATTTGTKASYDFYPTRAMLLDEFNAIWAAQREHHLAMTDEAKAEIEHIIFYHRPLKPAIVGKCTLDPATRPFKEDPEGYRAPWSHPLAQRFRILSEARNLEIRETGKTSRRLTKDQSDLVVAALLANREVKFDKLRTLLKLPAEARFNLESDRRSTATRPPHGCRTRRASIRRGAGFLRNGRSRSSPDWKKPKTKTNCSHGSKWNAHLTAQRPRASPIRRCRTAIAGSACAQSKRSCRSCRTSSMRMALRAPAITSWPSVPATTIPVDTFQQGGNAFGRILSVVTIELFAITDRVDPVQEQDARCFALRIAECRSDGLQHFAEVSLGLPPRNAAQDQRHSAGLCQSSCVGRFVPGTPCRRTPRSTSLHGKEPSAHAFGSTARSRPQLPASPRPCMSFRDGTSSSPARMPETLDRCAISRSNRSSVCRAERL